MGSRRPRFPQQEVFRAPRARPWRRRRCPRCGHRNHRIPPVFRDVIVECDCCGTLYEARSRRVVRDYEGPGTGGEAAGVHEPRRPLPMSGAGAAALPIPEAHEDIA